MSELNLTDCKVRILKAMYDFDIGCSYVLYVNNGNVYTVREHLLSGARDETAQAWQTEIDDLVHMGVLYGSPDQNYFLTNDLGEHLAKRMSLNDL